MWAGGRALGSLVSSGEICGLATRDGLARHRLWHYTTLVPFSRKFLVNALTDGTFTCRLAIGHISDRVTGVGLALCAIMYILVVRPFLVSLFTMVIVLGIVLNLRGRERMHEKVVIVLLSGVGKGRLGVRWQLIDIIMYLERCVSTW